MRETDSTYQSQLEGWQTHHSFTEDEDNEHDWAQEFVHISWKPGEKMNLLISKIASEVRLQVVNRVLNKINWIRREELIIRVGQM